MISGSLWVGGAKPQSDGGHRALNACRFKIVFSKILFEKSFLLNSSLVRSQPWSKMSLHAAYSLLFRYRPRTGRKMGSCGAVYEQSSACACDIYSVHRLGQTYFKAENKPFSIVFL